MAISPSSAQVLAMELGSWLMIGLLGGAFLFGIWFMLVREDDRHERSMTVQRQNVSRRGSPDFSRAKNEFDRKLAQIESHLASKRRLEAERLALEQASQTANQEAEAQRIAEDEAARLAEIEAEEARRQAEYEAKRQAELEDARKLAEEREAERLAEEERLAAEREARRQQEMAEAEAQRLEEIEAQRAADELAAKEASEAAMKELRERLEREGAKSSDVQISLIWNNYNDLDLHVVCPSGERIHGGNRNSDCGGELDVDANVRPETKKPVENVVWPEGEAPGGNYQVYVHHYMKHKKRRSKDPTKFKVICNTGGEIKEFEGSLSHGDPIMLICEFTVDSPEERAARSAEVKAELEALERGDSVSEVEESVEEEQSESEELLEELVEELPEESMDSELSDAIDELLDD